MKKRLIRDVARLASKQYQIKHVISGTSSSYLLPEELLETAQGTLQTLLSNESLFKHLSEHELEAARVCLESLYATDIQFNDGMYSNENLILHNESWDSIRQAAQKLLSVLGVSESKANEIIYD